MVALAVVVVFVSLPLVILVFFLAGENLLDTKALDEGLPMTRSDDQLMAVLSAAGTGRYIKKEKEMGPRERLDTLESTATINLYS